VLAFVPESTGNTMLLALVSHEYPTEFINYGLTYKVGEWLASTSGARIQFPVQTLYVDSMPNAELLWL
jgi:hypothetical protein